MIAVVDSGVANLGSVATALRRIGAAFETTGDGQAIRSADAILLPGVGAFADAMNKLGANRLVEPLRAAAADGVPILGICLGMQLLAEESEEFGRHEGLGLVPGRVVPLVPARPGERVPNIGWCDVKPIGTASLFRAVVPDSAFYFAHSFHFACADSADIAAEIRFGGAAVSAAVQRGNVYGTQFHPEKSQDSGLEILAAFCDLARARADA